MYKKIFGIVLLMSLSNVSAAYTCSGAVTGVTIEPASGDIMPETAGGFSWPRLCSVSVQKNGIPTESCKVVYSTLLAAQATGKSVTFWFNDGGDCSSGSHPAWQPLTGWYFGPRINN